MKKYIIRKVNKELGESFCETRTFKKIVKRNELYTFKAQVPFLLRIVLFLKKLELE